MSKKKNQRKIDAQKRAEEFARVPRKKKCPMCQKPMVNTRKCEKCKKKKRLKSKANSRGRSKNTYLLEGGNN